MKLEKSDLELETLVSRINSGEIDLQPDFQRGEIWDSRRQRRLIDTVLRDWYIPAIHIVVDSDGNELVLDGQQRLAALRDFMGDKIKIDGSIEPFDEGLMALDGLRYSELSEGLRRTVRRFAITVIRLHDYMPQEPNELFFRLNQSYNLTPPEKRNALHGEARDQVKQLVSHFTDTGLLQRESIGFSNGRLAYDDVIARACVALEQNDLRIHIDNSVVEEWYRGDGFSKATIERMRSAGTLLLDQIKHHEGRIRFNKGTLQTWLLYASWAPGSGALPPSLLGSFELLRAAVRAGETKAADGAERSIYEIVRNYDDRASYRVTDVSSVLIRDLAIHLYSVANHGTSPRRGSERLLSDVSNRPEATVSFMSSFIESSHWGNPILDGLNS